MQVNKMPKCSYCGADIPKGQSYCGNKYTSLRFCSEEHFTQYVKIKTKPKPPVNFKPQQGTDRRKFTDYIQEWCETEPRWEWLMKQAKDIQEEYGLDWEEMYLVLKYCRVYEGVEWDMQWGLYQFFPKYIQPMREFKQQCQEAREMAKGWEPIEEVHEIKKSNKREKIFDGW